MHHSAKAWTAHRSLQQRAGSYRTIFLHLYCCSWLACWLYNCSLLQPGKPHSFDQVYHLTGRQLLRAMSDALPIPPKGTPVICKGQLRGQILALSCRLGPCPGRGCPACDKRGSQDLSMRGGGGFCGAINDFRFRMYETVSAWHQSKVTTVGFISKYDISLHIT